MLYYAVRHSTYTYKKFGSGSIDFPLGIYSYPSYLGVDIITASDMPESLLGFTDGHRIVIRDDIKDLQDFVLLHEEEHVKDMSANELEADKRALKRMISKRADEKKIERVLRLLEKRWHAKIPSPEEFLSSP